ncbi:MAG: hypothetical protein IT516_04445 [Burkholderiales bacterium]|nr:hypothetical protein [Burkholderiales bacterium]
MIALMILIVFGIWCVIGWNVCGSLVVRRVQRPLLRWSLIPVFWIVWFVGPIADEIIGGRIFDAECARLPEKKFFGPVHLGAGAFFDENGTRRWNNKQEFDEIRARVSDWWERVFVWQRKETRVLTFPVVIKRTETTIHYEPSNSLVLTEVRLWSSGGWIRRSLGTGILSGLTCVSPGQWPRSAETITF